MWGPRVLCCSNADTSESKVSLAGTHASSLIGSQNLTNKTSWKENSGNRNSLNNLFGKEYNLGLSLRIIDEYFLFKFIYTFF